MKLHRDLAEAAEHAEKVAAIVPLEESEHFTRAPKRILDALRADGVAAEIDKLVEFSSKLGHSRLPPSLAAEGEELSSQCMLPGESQACSCLQPRVAETPRP